MRWSIFFFPRSLSLSLLIGQPNRLCQLIVTATANNVSQWKYTWIWLDWVWCGHSDWKERKGPQHILKRYLFTAVSQRLLISFGQRFLACVFGFAYSCRSAINNTHVNTLNKKKIWLNNVEGKAGRERVVVWGKVGGGGFRVGRNLLWQ